MRVKITNIRACQGLFRTRIRPPTGIVQDQDQTADHSADDGTKGGDQIRQCHDDGDQDVVRHAADGHEDEVHDTDDDTVDDFTGDEFHQDLIAAGAETDESVVGPLGKHSMEEPLHSADLSRFVHQKIHGQDKSQEPGDQVAAKGLGRGYQLAQPVRKGIQNIIDHVVGRGLQCGGVQIVFGGQLRDLVQELVHAGGIAVKVGYQRDDAVDDLRDQRHEQQYDDQDQYHKSYHHGPHPCGALVLHFIKQLAFAKLCQRIDHIGDDRTQDYREDKVPDHTKGVEDRSDVAQQQVQDHRDAAGNGVRNPFVVLWKQFHRKDSFLFRISVTILPQD